MAKVKFPLFFFLIIIVITSSYAQYPVAPNETDAEGRRVGRWTILYDKDFKLTDIKDSVRYFRVITYNKGVPSGRVFGYYISGALQSEFSLLADQPEDVRDGEISWYYEKGSLMQKCFYKKGVVDGEFQKFYSNGVLEERGYYLNGEAHGLWETFYESGIKKVVINYNANKFHGEYQEYYPSGKVQRVIPYINGKTEGVSYTYYESGGVENKAEYKNDKLDGSLVNYSVNGTVIQKGWFVDGLKTGLWMGWGENGVKDFEGKFVNGEKEGKWIFYHENAAISSVSNYKNGKKEGECKSYYDNGQLKDIGQKKEGLQEGKWTYYFSNGKLDEVSNFSADFSNGLTTSYYESGGMKYKCIYKNGKADGSCENYYENGNMQSRISYASGVLQGYKELFNEKGILVDKTFYEKDSATGPTFQYYDDGILKRKDTLINNIKNGGSEAYYSNGNLSEKGYYKNGVKEGYWEFFHENGKIFKKGKYVKGKYQGIWEWYYDNGQLNRRLNTKDNYATGASEQFHANGKTENKGNYDELGFKQGLWVYYYSNGNIEKRGNYVKDNQVGTWEYFHENGTFQTKGKMDKGAQGTWVFYDSLGIKSMAVDYKDDLKDGKKIFYKDNKIDTVYKYHKGRLYTISLIEDSISSEITKHRYKEAEQLIGELKKMQQKYYAENETKRHFYLKKLEDLYYEKKEFEKSEEYSMKYLAALKKYKLDTTISYNAALNNLANSYYMQKRYAEAIRLYKESLSLKNKRGESSQIRMFNTLCNLSSAYQKVNKLDSALAILENYKVQLEENIGEKDSIYYKVLNQLALFHYNRSDFVKANDFYRSIVNIIEKKGDVNRSEYRYTLACLSNSYQSLNNYDSAHYYIENALGQYINTGDTLSSNYFYSMEVAATYRYDTKNFSASHGINMNILGKLKANPYINYTVYKNTLYNVVKYLHQLEQYSDALQYYQYIKTILEKDGDQNGWMYANVLINIANLQTELYTDKNQESVKLYETAVQIKRDAEGAESSAYFYAASGLSNFYSLVKEYDKSVLLGKELLSQIEKTLGTSSIVYAYHSSIVGSNYFNHSDFAQALPYYKEAHAYYSFNSKKNFVSYVQTSQYMANCLKMLNKEQEAESIFLKIIQEIETNLGKENNYYITATSYLIDMYITMNRNASAKFYTKELLPFVKSTLGENSNSYFNFLVKLSDIEVKEMKYEKADSVLVILKNLAIKHSGEFSKNYLTYLKRKANLEYVQKKYKEADLYYQQAMKLTERLYGKDADGYADILKEMAVFYRNTKRYLEAEAFGLKAKNIAERVYGNKTLNFAYHIETLARIYDAKGEFSKSEKYFDEAIAIYERENSKQSWVYLNALFSKAKMYASSGLYDKSKEAYEYYLLTVEKFDGKKGYYAAALSEIAILYQHSSNYEKAILYQKESQKIRENQYSVDDSRYVKGLITLGVIFLEANQPDSASICFEEYKKITTKLNPKDSLSMAPYYRNNAWVCHRKGQYGDAEKLLGTAFRIDKVIESDPASVINFYDSYARLYTSWGKLDKAEKYWKDVLSSVLNYTSKMFNEFSEQEKTQFWSTYSKDFEIYNTYCLEHRKSKPEVLQEMYNNRVATKAIVLNSINQLKKRIYASRDSSLIKKYENWQILKDRTAHYQGVSPLQLKEAGVRLDSLERQIEKLEKELNISSEEKKQLKSTSVKWSDIQKKLLPDEAAVEIVQFRHYTTHLTDSIVYAALILTSNTKLNPELIILPYGNKLESRYLSYYRNAIKFKTIDTLSYKVFWQPLEEKLKGINTLYVSLDGVYNQLNVNTLMLPDGSYLLDKRKLIIVSNTKDVLALKLNSRISKLNTSQGVHLFGYPDYDIGVDKLPPKADSERGVNSSLDFATHNSITKLPGTKEEMEKIVVLLADKQWMFQSYISGQATEGHIKNLQSPLVLHIATHGFFLGEEQVKLGSSRSGFMSGQKYNPLLMSGLMLSGATKSLLGYSSHEGENGILTALEASTLNLNNTELVILSACETGKGEIKVGEGVYGLQRAFQVAGSKATIMSLWKVDDNATQQLMESFYRYWIETGDKTEAFRKAQMVVRKKHSSPYYWGAFVMMGQ